MALITPPAVKPMRQRKPVQNQVVQPIQPTNPTQNATQIFQPPNQDAGMERNLKAEQDFVKNWQGQGGKLPTANEINKAVYGNENPQFNTPQGVQQKTQQQTITQAQQSPANVTQVSGATRSLQNPTGDDFLNIGRLAWDLSGQGQQQQQQYGSSSIDQFGGNRQAFMNLAQEYLKSGDVTDYLIRNAGINPGDQIARQRIIDQARGLNEALNKATQQHFGGETAPLTGAGVPPEQQQRVSMALAPQQSNPPVQEGQPITLPSGQVISPSDPNYQQFKNQTQAESTPKPTGNQITDEKSLVDYVKNTYGVDVKTGQTTPAQTIQGIVTDISRSLNLPDYSSRLNEIAKSRTDLMNERDIKIAQVNDNPWLSEASRSRQVLRVSDLYEQKIANKNAEYTLIQNNYDSARQQAQFVAGQAINVYQQNQQLEQKDRQFYVEQAIKAMQAQRDLEKAEPGRYKEVGGLIYDIKDQKWITPPGGVQKKIDSQVVDIDGKRALVDMQTGKIIQVLGGVPTKKTSGGTGVGFVSEQIQAPQVQTFDQYIRMKEQQAGMTFSSSKREQEKKLYDAMIAEQKKQSPQGVLDRLQNKIKNLPLNVRQNAVEQVRNLVNRGMIDEANRFTDGMGTPLGETQITDLVQAQLAQKNIQRLSNLIEKLGSRGPIIGRIRQKNPYDSDIVELDNLITQTVPSLARGIFKEVGVLTDQDISRYRATIANPTLTAEQARRATNQLLETIRSSISLQLNTYDKAGKNVAEFKDVREQAQSPIQSKTGETKSGRKYTIE